jgi:hypothetical protein
MNALTNELVHFTPDLKLMYEIINNEGYLSPNLQFDLKNIELLLVNTLLLKAKHNKSNDVFIYLEMLYYLSNHNQIPISLLKDRNEIYDIIEYYVYAIEGLIYGVDHYTIVYINELIKRLDVKINEPSVSLANINSIPNMITEMYYTLKNKIKYSNIYSDNDLVAEYSFELNNPNNDVEVMNQEFLHEKVLSIALTRVQHLKSQETHIRLSRDDYYYTIYGICMNLIDNTNWGSKE